MIAASTAIKWRIIMKLVSFAASGGNSYGAVVGDGVFDLGRRLGIVIRPCARRSPVMR
jgi:hypothetical protein